MVKAADSSLWFGTSGGVRRFDRAEWKIFGEEVGLSFSVASIWETADSSLWFAASGGGVSRFDGAEWQTFTVDDGLGANSVLSIGGTKDGVLWFGTIGGGVTRLNPPDHSLAQIGIIDAPPPRFGSDRFFFEFRRAQFNSQRLPLVSHVLVRGQGIPPDQDWEAFADINGFEVTSLSNGTWTLYVRVIDLFGNVDPTPASATFEVDLTSPTALIASPVERQLVHGRITVRGSVLDQSEKPDLKRYDLEYAPGTDVDAIPVSAWQQDRIERLALGSVLDSTLAIWDTEGLQGPYVLRLTAEDSLGHLSQETVSVRVVTTLEEIEQAQGGRIGDLTDQISLYIPPNGLHEDAQVTITSMAESDMELPVGPRTRLVSPIFRLAPDTLLLRKPATLALAVFEESDIIPEKLGLFTWSAIDEDWQRVGGTFDAEAGQVRGAIRQLGVYALFEAEVEEGEGPTLSDLACQPRMISPRGGGFAQQMEISFRLGRQVTTSVKVFNMAGHLVRALVRDQELYPGSNVFTWDGRDEERRMVYDGAYVVLVGADDRIAQKIVTVVNGQR